MGMNGHGKVVDSKCNLSLQKAILKNTEKLVELCVTKLSQDWFPLLDLLSLVFNPMSR